MNTTRKWILRTGALLVVLGFLLPSLTVSCSAMPGFGRTFTLAQLASEANQPLLYLVPIGAIVVVILSFLGSNLQKSGFFYAQISCMVVGLLSMGISYFTISNQAQMTGGFEISPEIGIFVLLIGYVSSAVGFWFEWQEFNHFQYLSRSAHTPNYQPVNEKNPFYQNHYPDPGSAGNPYLDPIRGNAPPGPILLHGETFQIGRGSNNDLQLLDSKVSRQHARLRYAQGAWFIQDQDSSHGTYVNDQIIQAQRLVSGDKILIGETILIFHDS